MDLSLLSVDEVQKVPQRKGDEDHVGVGQRGPGAPHEEGCPGPKLRPLPGRPLAASRSPSPSVVSSIESSSPSSSYGATLPRFALRGWGLAPASAPLLGSSSGEAPGRRRPQRRLWRESRLSQKRPPCGPPHDLPDASLSRSANDRLRRRARGGGHLVCGPNLDSKVETSSSLRRDSLCWRPSRCLGREVHSLRDTPSPVRVGLLCRPRSLYGSWPKWPIG